MRGAQTKDGRFPDFAPHPLEPDLANGTPGWADAGVFLPWELYVHYHDQRLLTASLPGTSAFRAGGDEARDPPGPSRRPRGKKPGR